MKSLIAFVVAFIKKAQPEAEKHFVLVRIEPILNIGESSIEEDIQAIKKISARFHKRIRDSIMDAGVLGENYDKKLALVNYLGRLIKSFEYFAELEN